MGLFVRGVDSYSHFERLVKCTECSHVETDSLFHLFRTQKNSLSVWRVDTTEKLEDAFLSISLTKSDIVAMNFLLIHDDTLQAYGMSVEATDPGCAIPLSESASIHYDIHSLTYGTLSNAIEMYKRIYQEHVGGGNMLIVSKTKQEIKRMLSDNMDRISTEHANDRMRARLAKLFGA